MANKRIQPNQLNRPIKLRSLIRAGIVAFLVGFGVGVAKAAFSSQFAITDHGTVGVTVPVDLDHIEATHRQFVQAFQESIKFSREMETR